MLVYTIFSLSKKNQEGVNNLLMQVHCVSSLRDVALLLYSAINCKKDDVAYLF